MAVRRFWIEGACSLAARLHEAVPTTRRQFLSFAATPLEDQVVSSPSNAKRSDRPSLRQQKENAEALGSVRAYPLNARGQLARQVAKVTGTATLRLRGAEPAAGQAVLPSFELEAEPMASRGT